MAWQWCHFLLASNKKSDHGSWMPHYVKPKVITYCLCQIALNQTLLHTFEIWCKFSIPVKAKSHKKRPSCIKKFRNISAFDHQCCSDDSLVGSCTLKPYIIDTFPPTNHLSIHLKKFLYSWSWRQYVPLKLQNILNQSTQCKNPKVNNLKNFKTCKKIHSNGYSYQKLVAIHNFQIRLLTCNCVFCCAI